MKLLSNLIKSNFIAFSQDDALVIDANKNKIIQAIDSASNECCVSAEESVEEALAEALIRDAELEGVDFGDDVLTFDTAQLPNLEGVHGDLDQVANEVRNSAKQEAEEIVNRAHDEAEQLRANAYDEAEQIKKDAYEEGYQQGYQEAVSVANEEIAKQKAELEQQKRDLQVDLEKHKDSIVRETEYRMVDILCSMVKRLTGVVVEDYKGVLLYMINNAMKDQDNSRHFVIKLSSGDFAEIEKKKENIYGALNPNVDIQLFEDSKLEPLQCLIETDNGIVDLSLDVQLDNLLTALKLMIKD